MELQVTHQVIRYFEKQSVMYIQQIQYSTGLFISPSAISELDCATTKTDTAERSISIGRESLQVFFLYYGPWRASRFHRYGVVVKKNGFHSE